ncbi:Nitrogen permease regulator 2 [Physocladia obscura]|uniref:Nitrogen permease regulator 2 n=1 Tax=Physocladia obscura TaxID=109957 RepID=A0AAD5T5L8_9FUNG|nr:Nitrogen permease regulator 2 [Physocladia obscura]
MQFARIQALFYAEFHPIQGPVLVYSAPEGSVVGRGVYAGPDTIQFDAFSVIPKPRLFNRLVTVSASPARILVGFPVSINDPRYDRNAFIFNLVFIFDVDADISPYEQIVTKVARILRSLEEESRFLSNNESKHRILDIMEQIIQDLNSHFECKIPINDFETINLKLFQKYQQPPNVHPWEVPVQVYQLSKIRSRDWDMTILQIIPSINGVRSIKKISESADVELDLVALSIQHLIFYGYVKMVDIFQFSNVYTVNATNLKLLLEDESLQYEMQEFVQKNLTNLANNHGLTVRQWSEDNGVMSLNIDIRRFFVFGAMQNILNRVHKYPVLYSPNQRAEFLSQPLVPPTQQMTPPVTAAALNVQAINANVQNITLAQASANSIDPKKLVPFLDGHHHMDVINSANRNLHRIGTLPLES